MIRGVNRNIIEICETESDYFEKVILFVKPGCICRGESELKRHADIMIKGFVPLGITPKKSGKSGGAFFFVRFLIPALFGAAVTVLFMKFALG